MEESIDQLDYQSNPRREFLIQQEENFGTTPNYGIGDLMREITVTPQSGLDVVTYGGGLVIWN